MNEYITALSFVLISHCAFCILYLSFYKKEVFKSLIFLFVVICMPILGSIISQHFGLRNDFTAIAFSPAVFFLIGPLLYFYCASIFCVKLNYSKLWHLIPFSVFTILLAFFNPPPPPVLEHEMLDVILKEKRSPILPKYVLSTCIMLSNLIYGYFIIRLINKKNKRSKEFYSTTDNSITLKWFKWLVVVFVMMSLFSFVLKELIVVHREEVSFKYASLITNIAFVYFLSSFSFRQNKLKEYKHIDKSVVIELKPDQNIIEKKPAIDEDKFLNLSEDLDKLMDDKKVFLNENLRLSDLASLLNVSVNELSFFINKYYNKNFFKFINQYRVDYACALLKDQSYQNYTILAIAYESGFNSKSTFNQVFKELKGQTPSKYKSA